MARSTTCTCHEQLLERVKAFRDIKLPYAPPSFDPLDVYLSTGILHGGLTYDRSGRPSVAGRTGCRQTTATLASRCRFQLPRYDAIESCSAAGRFAGYRSTLPVQWRRVRIIGQKEMAENCSSAITAQ